MTSAHPSTIERFSGYADTYDQFRPNNSNETRVARFTADWSRAC
jgi:hypothetical protein